MLIKAPKEIYENQIKGILKSNRNCIDGFVYKNKDTYIIEITTLETSDYIRQLQQNFDEIMRRDEESLMGDASYELNDAKGQHKIDIETALNELKKLEGIEFIDDNFYPLGLKSNAILYLEDEL